MVICLVQRRTLHLLTSLSTISISLAHSIMAGMSKKFSNIRYVAPRRKLPGNAMRKMKLTIEFDSTEVPHPCGVWTPWAVRLLPLVFMSATKFSNGGHFLSCPYSSFILASSIIFVPCDALMNCNPYQYTTIKEYSRFIYK